MQHIFISIHALREEGDFSRTRPSHRKCNFNPRPPRGGRLKYWCMESMPIWISIHALREEGDVLFDKLAKGDFTFQSTPSARRATRPAGDVCGRY